MTYDNRHEILEELFHSLLSRYQISLETQIRGSDFICDCVNFYIANVAKYTSNVTVYKLTLQIG